MSQTALKTLSRAVLKEAALILTIALISLAGKCLSCTCILLLFSRVLRGSTPRYVGLLVSRSVGRLVPFFFLRF